ncbi:MAG: thermonuclease family protein [Steroidobacteraceae bacterium]
MEAKIQGVVMDFRLAAADAPESDQSYGQEATREVQQLIRDKQLVLVPTDTDRYGRTIVFAWAGGQCVNKEMVKRGAAWFNSEYSNDAELFETENEARDGKRGLWGLENGKRMEPWVWRERSPANRPRVAGTSFNNANVRCRKGT